MRIQADSVAVVIDRCMTDSNLGHGDVELLNDIQINTLCASKPGGVELLRNGDATHLLDAAQRSRAVAVIA